VGGLPEFVEPEGCGFVVPPRSPEALSGAIRQALADPEALAEMGRRARRRIGRDHDWSAVARQTLAVYQGRPA
jgi:glycosyltransferase involved in cell wall biosynthesis